MALPIYRQAVPLLEVLRDLPWPLRGLEAGLSKYFGPTL